jgi:hypothetical protein
MTQLDAARKKVRREHADRNGQAPSASTQSTQKTAAQRLLEMALTNAEFWHTPDDVAYVTIPRGGHLEHWPVRSRAFRQWLGLAYYLETNKAVGSQTMQDVANVLEGKARYQGPPYTIFVRVAGHEGRIYLDLCDDDWRAVEVNRTGWRIVDTPPVRFRRTRGMLALPVPVRGGSVAELRQFVNVADEHWPMVLGFQVGALRPTGPYAALKLFGEQGSAKTTVARVLRALIDPNTASVRSAPRSERDLMISANNGWLINFDNLSWIEPDLSDALCRLATGGGFATRMLYENDEEVIFDAQRPVILNGIEDLSFRSDLMDRCLVVELPRIEPSRRRAETVFWREFEQARPRILGALLDAAAAALENLPAVEQSDTRWPRMADFAMWVTAAEPALGLPAGQFLAAYEANRQTANQTALESSLVVSALQAMLEKRNGRTFEGTATALLREISLGQDTRVKEWPKNARALAGRLERLAPNLRQSGWTVEKGRKGNDKFWHIVAAP